MFWRLKCHACGHRSPHSRNSGINRFQCSDCQAWTYLDRNGEYADPPADAIGVSQVSVRPPRARQPATIPSPQIIFCDTCLHNQHLYHQLLSEYLPDEDHPQYARYVSDLPKYKAELEKRHPQICQECAPKAQSVIHNADYLSMTNNASRLLGRSRGGRRSMSPEPVHSRDTAERVVMRTILTIVGALVDISAIIQILWHAYGVVEIEQDFGSRGRIWDKRLQQDIFAGTPKLSECLESMSSLDFTYPCYRSLAAAVWWAIVVSGCLIWYNPGLRRLYSSDVRIAAVSGWRQHLSIMLFVLVSRIVAFYYLADVLDADIKPRSTGVALHLSAIVVMVLGHHLAQRGIELEKWKVKGSMMPRPEERDVLSQYAGPARETFTPQVSLTGPAQLLERDPRAFPIENLAPRRRGAKQSTPQKIAVSVAGSDYGDPMDIEPVPPAQQHGPAHSAFGQATGWDTVRTNLFSIDDEMRARQEQGRTTAHDDKHMYFQPRPQTQSSAFKGRLPQAPMSQERRMRNPVTQTPVFKEVPSTQRQDFLQQMRAGIDRGRGFMREGSVDSDVSELQTASSRTRGQLNLAQSDWHLPADIDKATGLEDMFGGSFNIEDPRESTSAPSTSTTPLTAQEWRGVQVLLTLALLLGFVFDIGGIRRTTCLYFVGILEQMGY